MLDPKPFLAYPGATAVKGVIGKRRLVPDVVEVARDEVERDKPVRTYLIYPLGLYQSCHTFNRTAAFTADSIASAASCS